MTRAVLLLLALSGTACSRGSHPADDGPLAPATAPGIPSAATSARVATPESMAPATTLSALGTVSTPPGGGHVPPHVHDDGATLSSAGLPSEVVRRIVRQNFGRFRLCYENGLRANPSLAGRVSTRFVIDKTGAVSITRDEGSDLPSASTVACVVRGFGNLSFPQPEGGIVSVLFPITFSPR
jgi:hypothetical protein